LSGAVVIKPVWVIIEVDWEWKAMGTNVYLLIVEWCSVYLHNVVLLCGFSPGILEVVNVLPRRDRMAPACIGWNTETVTPFLLAKCKKKISPKIVHASNQK